MANAEVQALYRRAAADGPVIIDQLKRGMNRRSARNMASDPLAPTVSCMRLIKLFTHPGDALNLHTGKRHAVPSVQAHFLSRQP